MAARTAGRKLSGNSSRDLGQTETGPFPHSQRLVRPEIREEARRRSVSGVYHFTRINNLSSILNSGLITRHRIDKGEIEASVNDELRLEKCRNSVCCSIGFPNYKMFYKLRQSIPESGGWAVLHIDESVLWENPCSFYPANAASREFCDRYVTEFTSVQAFRALFDQTVGHPTRDTLGLDPGLPTNPQAEVLVRSDIERDYIRGVYFEHQSQADEWSSFSSEFLTAVDRELYSQRRDYNYW